MTRAALAVLAAPLLACYQTTTEPAPLSADQAIVLHGPWEIRNSSGMPGEVGSGFEFPQAPGWVGYVFAYVGCALPEGATVTASYTIEGTAEFNADVPENGGDGQPAQVTLYLQGVDGSRWWAGGSRRVLAAGGYEMSAPLDAEHWTGVWGQTDPAAFARAIANVNALGVTFGGRSFYGHAVNTTSGRAEFRIGRMEVMR